MFQRDFVFILLKLNLFVEENNILPSEQFGFRHDRGTDFQLLRIVDLLTTNFTNKCCVLGIFLDAEKAYDKIWHQGLIYKLMDINIPRYLIHIIQSLSNRTFQIKLNGSLSSLRYIRAGVPQGAVLSPLLFNLYIADIPKSPNTSISLFADDIAVFSAHRNVKYAYCNLIKHITSLERWFLKWRIKINVAKSCVVPYSWKKHILLPEVKLYDEIIQRKNTAKYLGILLDKKLLFKEHINAVLNKAIVKYTTLYPLLKSPTLNIETKKQIYMAIIRSGLTYAGGVWRFAAKTHRSKLQILQNKVLRTISGFDRTTKITQIHEDLEIQMIDDYLSEISKKLWTRTETSDIEIVRNIGKDQHKRITWRTPRQLV